MDISLDLGKVAYDAYFNHAHGYSLVTSQPLPVWEKLAKEIQDGWRIAALAVVEKMFPGKQVL